METITLVILSALFTKLADSLKGVWSNIFGVLYGITGGLLSFHLFPIVVGTTLANFLAGKVNKNAHYIGATIILLISSFAPKTFLLFIPFIVIAAYLDEFTKGRPFLPLTILLLTPYTGWLYLFYMIVWDITYNLTSYTLRRPVS